jgi:E3 ubiquitin-protein ligase CCNP1IP1
MNEIFLSSFSMFTLDATEFERDLELERRKVRDLQEASRDRDKEYQKLKVELNC